MRFLKLSKPDSKLYCRPTLPSSKSISTRLLILKSLYPGLIRIENLSSADDVKLLQKNLEYVHRCAASDIPYIIYSKNSGAVMRFMTAYASVMPGQRLLTGDERLLTRPVKGLVESLRQMGADIEYSGRNGFCPLKINGTALRGGQIRVDASQSSQFVTALLLIANELEGNLKLILKGKPASEKYILLTLDILKRAGMKIRYSDGLIHVVKSGIKPARFRVESDWASASFWYMMLGLADEGEVVFNGLQQNSLLPEAALPDLFKKAGIETLFSRGKIKIKKSAAGSEKIKVDFRDNPDLSVPFIMYAALAGLEAEFTGLNNLAHKESNRLLALISVLEKLSVNYASDGKGIIAIQSGKAQLKKGASFDGRNDHRLIMSLAAVAMKFQKEIKIRNYEAVEKSYPDFWKDLSKAGFSMKEAAR